MKEARLLTSDLVYHWTFTDNMSVVDNPRIKATVFGNPTYNNGIATFNGSTDYYKLKTLINLGTKYSIEVRFKLNVVGATMFILGNDDSANVYAINISGNGNIVSKTTNARSVTTPFNRDLNWHTYTIARNGSNILTYIDGIAKTSSSDITASDLQYIGSIGGTIGGAYKWNGQLEYIKIWNRQLSTSEVKNNYNGKIYKSLPYVSSEIAVEVITNQVDREFSSDTGYWTKSGETIIGNGVCNIKSTAGAYSGISAIILNINKIYRIKFHVTRSSITNSTFEITGFGTISLPTIVGIYEYVGTASLTTLTVKRSGICDIDLDNISIKEVTQSAKNTLFHINSDNGVIRDLIGKTTPVNTNMTLKPLGSNIKVISSNGTNSNLAIGSNLITGDLTLLTVLNATSLGEGSSNQYGMVFSNSKLQIWLNDSTNRIGISRDGGTTKVYSNNNVVKFGNTVFLMITTTATGITNVYSCGKNSNLALASTSNLGAGSLVDTAHLTYIGDDGTGNRTFNGWISNTMMIQGILTIEEGSQYVSSNKYKYI
jgi:hypothetical protein